MLLGRMVSNTYLISGDTTIECSTEETILGIIIDNKLSFNSHISNICIIANQTFLLEYPII